MSERNDFEVFRDKRNAQLEKEGHKPGSRWHVDNSHYPTWQAARQSSEVNQDLYEAVHEAVAAMPSPVGEDDGDTQAEHIMKAIAPYVRQSSEAEPVAYLKFRSVRIAADDVVEGFEVADKGDIGDDGSKAFPVYDQPPARVPEKEFKSLLSGLRTMNRSEAHNVQSFVGDDEPCYYQRKEWVDWIMELCDEAEAALLTHQPSAERVADVKGLLTREGHLAQDAAYSRVDGMTLRERQIAEKWVESIERLARALLKQEGDTNG